MTILLDVPFEKKDDAKKNKCKWNNEAKDYFDICMLSNTF